MFINLFFFFPFLPRLLFRDFQFARHEAREKGVAEEGEVEIFKALTLYPLIHWANQRNVIF